MKHQLFRTIVPVILFACSLTAGLGHAAAQTIYTLAGTGVAGFTGTGGAATAAELNNPQGVAVDAAGNVYIADFNNDVIRKVSTSGVISTFAGGGSSLASGIPATASQLIRPGCVAVDAAGNVYIADNDDGIIRKVNTSGIITTVAGGGSSLGDGGPATNGQLSNPYGIAVDASGNLYIADVSDNRIRKVNTLGIISTIAGTGTAGYNGDGIPGTAAKVNYPYGVAADGSGNVYIADRGNNVIRKIDASGIITTVAGTDTVYGYSGDGGAATAAKLQGPEDVILDASGNMYIADEYNNVIRKVSSTGTISTYAGNSHIGYSGDGGPATAAEMYYPVYVALNPANGDLYIGDYLNNRVRVVIPSASLSVGPVSAGNYGLRLFPDPNKGTCTLLLTAQDNGQAQVVVSNMAGEEVSKLTVNANKETPLHLNAPPGTYLLSARTSQGVYSARIVIQ